MIILRLKFRALTGAANPNVRFKSRRTESKTLSDMNTSRNVVLCTKEHREVDKSIAVHRFCYVTVAWPRAVECIPNDNDERQDFKEQLEWRSAIWITVTLVPVQWGTNAWKPEKSKGNARLPRDETCIGDGLVIKDIRYIQNRLAAAEWSNVEKDTRSMDGSMTPVVVSAATWVTTKARPVTICSSQISFVKVW